MSNQKVAFIGLGVMGFPMAGHLAKAGHDVVVAAPLDERSGWGAGVGYMVNGTEFDVERRAVPGRPGIETWGVEGPPAFCVLTAMLETFGPRPDLVVSGSNIGLNLGRGVLHPVAMEGRVEPSRAVRQIAATPDIRPVRRNRMNFTRWTRMPENMAPVALLPMAVLIWRRWKLKKPSESE